MEVYLALPVVLDSTAVYQVPQEREQAPSKVRIVADEAFRRFKEVAYHAALTLVKIVALPLELAALAVVVVLASFTFFSHNIVRAVDHKGVTPFEFMLAGAYGIKELMKITLTLGFDPKSERLQLADNEPNSPKCVVISPKEVSSDATPILYAPGYLDSPTSLRLTCRKIANMTNSPVYIVKYRSLFQSVEEHAKDVARVQKRIQQDHKRSDIVYIGHSMGGLTTGRFIQQNNVQAKLWITIGSPVNGTPISKIGIGACAKDMNPGSTICQSLRDSEVLDNTPALHIYSKVDLIVPAFSMPYRQSQNSTVYQCSFPYGHLGVRDNPEVLALIGQKLASPVA